MMPLAQIYKDSEKGGFGIRGGLRGGMGGARSTDVEASIVGVGFADAQGVGILIKALRNDCRSSCVVRWERGSRPGVECIVV